MPVAWNEDPPGSEPRLLANADALLQLLRVEVEQRPKPSIAAAQGWHRRLYEGIELPVPYYAGEIRDSDPRYPELDGYEVAIGPFQGVPSAQVPDELATFESNAREAVARLDVALPVGQVPSTDADLIGALTLCALLHGEWIRIRPFANGNGRTARVWANWAALRYSLPTFIAIKPRPFDDAHRIASVASMHGRHEVAVAAFNEMLLRALP